MLRVGLTGGIGSGKSTVARALAAHGATVIDADRLARDVVAPGTEGLAEVVAAFGPAVLAQDGALDRSVLAHLVFSDDSARHRLNAIVHPRVGARTEELTRHAATDAVLVHDVPLLVENGLAPTYHLVIVVDAPVAERVRRLVAQRGMTERDIRARIVAQADDDQRRMVADVWLDNGGGSERVRAAVDDLWARRLVPFEANVRTHRCAPRGGPRVVPADPTWPVQAERIAARLRAAAGDLASRVDHVGSTSVPGLAAQDVLDLQLTVDRIEDADPLVGPLSEAGFPPCRQVRVDRPAAADLDPERLSASADPGRPVNVHLRVAGTPGWRYALLLPAWLRADGQARAEYGALKRALAVEHADGTAGEYAAAKEPWFDSVVERARRWARDTGWTPSTP